MSSQLSVNQLAERLHNFPYDRYLYIGSFMRSVAWAAGTIVLLSILGNGRSHLPRLLPWAVTLLATMVTLMTWGRGVLFTNSRATVWDSVLPTAMGVMEFCLFAILEPQVFGSAAPTFDFSSLAGFMNRVELWHLWFFVLAAHTAFAVALVHNRIRNTKISEDYEPQLQPLAKQYMEWMKRDRLGAAIATLISIVSGFLMIWMIHEFKSVLRAWIHVLCGIGYTVLFIGPGINLVKVIKYAEAQRQEADNKVFRMLPRVPTAE